MTMIFIIRCSVLGLLGIAAIARGQIPPEDIPPEFQFLLSTDLDEWDPPGKIKKNCPYYLSGFDEENRPIWVAELGVWPTSDIVSSGPEWQEAYDKYFKQLLRRGFQSLKLRATPEQPVTEFTIIIDMDKFSLRSIGSITAIRVITSQFQLIAKLASYTNGVYVVNTNYFGEKALNLLRPVLGSIGEKIEVYGTNSKAWTPKLLKLLPRSQISERYGGEKGFKPVQAYG